MIKGRLAQLVQSTSFTPRGSGVRTPHRPQKTSTEMLEFFLFNFEFRFGKIFSLSLQWRGFYLQKNKKIGVKFLEEKLKMSLLLIRTPYFVLF